MDYYILIKKNDSFDKPFHTIKLRLSGVCVCVCVCGNIRRSTDKHNTQEGTKANKIVDQINRIISKQKERFALLVDHTYGMIYVILYRLK